MCFLTRVCDSFMQMDVGARPSGLMDSMRTEVSLSTEAATFNATEIAGTAESQKHKPSQGTANGIYAIQEGSVVTQSAQGPTFSNLVLGPIEAETQESKVNVSSPTAYSSNNIQRAEIYLDSLSTQLDI